MRFSIWAAVSTLSQAEEDKASLAEQENKCRSVALTRAWQETGGPYIVPGESRTRFVNLRDAENEIPALHALLEDGKAGRFDILLLYDYNRLRDLLDPVAKTLASYGVQIYSVNQPVEPLPPEEFNPYASDSESMMRGMSQIISRWQIADLRRKYRYGVSSRVHKGLPSLRIPYGYVRPPGREQDRNAVPIKVPSQARVIMEIKERFLAGQSYYEIRDELNARGVPSPQDGRQGWSHQTIKKILLNLFYAGRVFFGRSRTVRDPNKNTVRLKTNPAPLIREGKHEPIYAWEEYQAILIEMKRRESLPRHNRYQFSGLLVCSICGARLMHDHGIWRCKQKDQPKKDHIGLRVEEALVLIPRVLQKELQSSNPSAPSLSTTQPDTAIQELERQRRRIQLAYESEVYSIEEAETKMKSIDAQINALRDDEMNRLRRQSQHKQFMATFQQAHQLLQYLPQWVMEEDPLKVNNLLLRLCREIVVTPDGQFTIHFRE